MKEKNVAFGAPGMEPRWTQSTKEGIGTAYHTGCRLWFTLSHGIINEIYYPQVDTPNTRDLQFLVTDGETFCHEERRDFIHEIAYPEKGALLYQITNTEKEGRYRIIKEICTDAHSSVLLQHTKLEILDKSLEGKLRMFALLAPHLERGGWNNSAIVCDHTGRRLMRAWKEKTHLVMGASPDFLRRSVGYVAFSDGWQDLQNFQMDWTFTEALEGNVALTAEVDLSRDNTFTLGVSFGHSGQSAAAKLLQSLATPFAENRQTYVEQWQRVTLPKEYAEHTGDGGSLYRVSRCILLAHEDKTFSGALVASMSIPWGEDKSDEELGGYHLVWPRDLMQSAVALLASGQKETPRRALIWLACLQEENGKLPQNSWINGEPYWKGLQLDEIAAPILLAWRLHEQKALDEFDPAVMVSRAASFLMLHGPATKQERWEEAGGYSPSTLACILGSLVCAAEFAKERGGNDDAEFIYSYADWLSDHIEEWTVTNCGELLPGTPRHFIRVCPTDFKNPHVDPKPDSAILNVANGGGEHPARNVVGGDFLALVRLGLRDPLDELFVDSLKVIDAVLKHDLPQGPCWLRYNHDGYGQKASGDPFDGEGVGGCWPLLTGERGHYELAAGRDPLSYIHALEGFANKGGMLPEQVWSDDTIPDVCQRGEPTGSAMPLCWAHAEYIALVRSRADGVPFERIKPAYERYVKQKSQSSMEMWTLAHQLTKMPAGKTLRIITEKPAVILYSEAGNLMHLETSPTGLGCFFADLPTSGLEKGAEVTFSVALENEFAQAGNVYVW